MGRARNAMCRYYIEEGNCEVGKEGTFNKACQKCRMYSPYTYKKSYNPKDRRKAKKEKHIRQEELMDEAWGLEEEKD